MRGYWISGNRDAMCLDIRYSRCNLLVVYFPRCDLLTSSRYDLPLLVKMRSACIHQDAICLYSSRCELLSRVIGIFEMGSSCTIVAVFQDVDCFLSFFFVLFFSRCDLLYYPDSSLGDRIHNRQPLSGRS